MKWTNDAKIMIAFDAWMESQNETLRDFLKEIEMYLPRNDTSMLLVTFAKFNWLYNQHRAQYFDEDLTLSFHRVLNTVMGDEQTRAMFGRMATMAAGKVVGVE
jgi:hypothetical protein